jgi:hypothetical protein
VIDEKEIPENASIKSPGGRSYPLEAFLMSSAIKRKSYSSEATRFAIHQKGICCLLARRGKARNDQPKCGEESLTVAKRLPEWTNTRRDLSDEKSLFSEKGQMLSKRYEPHCPSRTCTGRDKNKLYRIRGSPSWLTREVWAKKKAEEDLCRCAHCGLVWFQNSSKRLGLDARPVGYYDDFEHPWEFVSLKHRYKIREQNTSRYWVSLGRKAIRSPRWGGVD